MRAMYILINRGKQGATMSRKKKVSIPCSHMMTQSFVAGLSTGVFGWLEGHKMEEMRWSALHVVFSKGDELKAQESCVGCKLDRSHRVPVMGTAKPLTEATFLQMPVLSMWAAKPLMETLHTTS